jgi:hypothetical protein
VPSWKRQGERICLSELDPLSEPAARGQDTCRFYEVGRQVDRRHPATAVGRQVARGVERCRTAAAPRQFRKGASRAQFTMIAEARMTDVEALAEFRARFEQRSEIID